MLMKEWSNCNNCISSYLFNYKNNKQNDFRNAITLSTQTFNEQIIVFIYLFPGCYWHIVNIIRVKVFEPWPKHDKEFLLKSSTSKRNHHYEVAGETTTGRIIAESQLEKCVVKILLVLSNALFHALKTYLSKMFLLIWHGVISVVKINMIDGLRHTSNYNVKMYIFIVI